MPQNKVTICVSFDIGADLKLIGLFGQKCPFCVQIDKNMILFADC